MRYLTEVKGIETENRMVARAEGRGKKGAIV